MNLLEVKNAVEKELDITLEEGDDNYILIVDKDNEEYNYYLRKYSDCIYVAFEIRIKNRDIFLSCSQNITIDYHLGSFFHKVKEIKELAKQYL